MSTVSPVLRDSRRRETLSGKVPWLRGRPGNTERSLEALRCHLCVRACACVCALCLSVCLCLPLWLSLSLWLSPSLSLSISLSLPLSLALCTSAGSLWPTLVTRVWEPPGPCSSAQAAAANLPDVCDGGPSRRCGDGYAFASGPGSLVSCTVSPFQVQLVSFVPLSRGITEFPLLCLNCHGVSQVGRKGSSELDFLPRRHGSVQLNSLKLWLT